MCETSHIGDVLIYGMGYRGAWYWTQITGEKLTPELTHLGIALSAFCTIFI